jgi:hypothetical protein
MYNSKNPCIKDESIPSIQHNYKRDLHSYVGYIPFQMGLGFQPLGPINVALPLATTQEECSHVRLTKPLDSLSRFNKSTNRSMRFYKNPLLSTSNAMINTRYHTNFRWDTSFGYICRKSASQGPIESSVHFSMGLTLSLRMWVKMILSSTFPHSLACTQCSMWTSFGHIFHHYWTPLRLQNSLHQ